MEERLKYIFGNVNDWLKFAEAKNGILIAFNGAAIFGLLQSKSSITDECLQKYLYFICIPLLTVSICISLFSLLPILKLFFKEPDHNPIEKEKRKEYSIFYFDHLKEFGYAELVEKLYIAEGKSVPNPIPSIELDLSHQIITNANIAVNKNIAFRISASLTLCLFIIPFPFVIYYLIKEIKSKYSKNDK